MSCLDRFIKVPIELIDKQLLEINGSDENADNTLTYAKINPFEISHYHPKPDKDNNLKKVIIYFKNGESLWIDFTIKEFENLLSQH